MSHHHHPTTPPAEMSVKALEAYLASLEARDKAEDRQQAKVGAASAGREVARETVRVDMTQLNTLRIGSSSPDLVAREISQIRSVMKQTSGVMPMGLDAKLMALSTSNDINFKAAQSRINPGGDLPEFS